MRATSPQDRLGGGSDNSLPPVKFPVGTPFPAHLLHDNGVDKPSYYIGLIMKAAESKLRKTLQSLKRQGYMKRCGRSIASHQHSLDEIRNIVSNPDSVEVAGHAPNGMHVVDTIANQCYIRGVPGAASGMGWDMYLCFRKTINGKKLVYIHGEPIFGECYLEHYFEEKAKKEA